MKQPLTPQEEKTWGFILGFYEDNKMAPTLSEIANRLDIERYQAQRACDALERKGYLKWGKTSIARRSVEFL